MRYIGVLILLLTILTAFSPLTVGIQIAPASDLPYIITLDVCHSGDGAGPVNSDVPAFCEDAFSIVRPQSLQSIQPHNVLPLSFNLAFLKDRPPQY